jgi:hypothetical protein
MFLSDRKNKKPSPMGTGFARQYLDLKALTI